MCKIHACKTNSPCTSETQNMFSTNTYIKKSSTHLRKIKNPATPIYRGRWLRGRFEGGDCSAAACGAGSLSVVSGSRVVMQYT